MTTQTVFVMALPANQQCPECPQCPRCPEQECPQCPSQSGPPPGYH